jgi:hypothetical protein
MFLSVRFDLAASLHLDVLQHRTCRGLEFCICYLDDRRFRVKEPARVGVTDQPPSVEIESDRNECLVRLNRKQVYDKMKRHTAMDQDLVPRNLPARDTGNSFHQKSFD